MGKSGFINPRQVAAIELVGGIGERLGPLTWHRTKAAVPAGPTSLAAFSSSNGLNSGVVCVYLACQYLPTSLRRFYSTVYGGNCSPDGTIRFVYPQDISQSPSFKGTSDAYFQTLKIAAKANVDYILGLSGDHIVSVDFSQVFLQYPELPENALVILAKEVPREDAPRFGILNTEGNKVLSFEEKPALDSLPKREGKFLASMGIYFAPTTVWLDVLKRDSQKSPYDKKSGVAKNPETQTNFDIGGDVIPWMVKKGYPVYAFPFKGYWEDVGEPKALRRSLNDILIARSPDLISNPKWPIAAIAHPQFHSNGDTYFSSGRFDAKNSRFQGAIFSPGNTIHNSHITNSVLFGGSASPSSQEGTVVRGSEIRNAIIDKYVDVGCNSAIIAPDGSLILVSRGTVIPPNTRIESKGDAIVASLEELVCHGGNLMGFRSRVSPNVEFFLPNGTNVTIEQIFSY